MAPSHAARFAGVLAVALPLALLAGCPNVDAPLGLGADLAGTYWVEYQAGQLAVFELPLYRGDEGVWNRLTIAQPNWYTGPALYQVNADGSWSRVMAYETLTLDDVLQTYDPLPRVESLAG
jgi:hypothetical protein